MSIVKKNTEVFKKNVRYLYAVLWIFSCLEICTYMRMWLYIRWDVFRYKNGFIL